MAEKIEVGYTPAAFVGGLGICHKYILYTNNAGQQFYARGGPGYFGPGAEDGGRDEASTSPFGNIKTRTGVYDKNSPDWDKARDPTNTDAQATPHPRETITEGDDLSSEWKKIKDVMRDIDARDIPYDPRDTNSNASADEALRRSGLPTPTQDGPTGHWSPGSDFDLPGGDVAPGGKDFWKELGEWFRGKLDDIENTIRATSASLGSTPDPLAKTVKYVDPLILDLDGDSLEITPLSKGIQFDANNDTIKTGTAWAGADDGLLVWDRNGNGSIDSGAELFGDETILVSGTKAAQGFAALAELDSNGDGQFNADDARYADLRIWRDLNQDGINQAGELKTLAESGVKSIHLASTATRANYGDAILVQSSDFTRADGSTGQVGSFILAQNNFNRTFTPIAVSDQAKELPNIGGSGWVRDLQEAATLSPELIAAVNHALDATTYAGYKDAVATLMREWGNDSAYNNAGKQALAAGYGLVLSDPLDDQERSWMDMSVKANDAERDAYRATLSDTDLAKFDAMRERMVGGLEKMFAYEALTLEAANDGEWRMAA